MIIRLGLGITLALGLFLRCAGLFRDIAWGYTIHPDEPKQIVTLSRYLHGRYYLWRGRGEFYDGYPFGLNLLDGLFLRLTSAAGELLGLDTIFPDRESLYYASRILRVLFGVGCLALVAIAARRLFSSWPPVILATLLAAMAPVSYAVTHTATGDVGVDLAAAATLPLLAGLGPGALTYATAGLVVGLGFAAKYNAVILLGIVGIFGVLTCRGSLRTLLRWATLSALGFVAGYVLLTPWAWVDPGHAVSGILRNLEHARTYGPAEVLALPLHERFVSNLARVVPGFGLLTVVLAGAGSLLAGIARLPARNDPEAARSDTVALVPALAFFTIPALLFLCATKVYLQPFHVSFLVFPLALLAAHAVQVGIGSRRIGPRVATAIVTVLALLELGRAAERETYFWLRDDVRSAQIAATSALREYARIGPDSPTLRSFRIEDANVPVFRNRPQAIGHADAPFWRSLGAVPAPAIPLRTDTDWIFFDGPELFRSDRRVALEPGASTGRGLVFEGAVPEIITVGVRAGRHPSRVEVRLGGALGVFDLDPDEQATWSVRPTPSRVVAHRDPGETDVSIVSMRARTWGGAAQLAILPSPGDAARFLAFGGGDLEPLARWARNLPKEKIVSRLPGLLFIEDATERPVPSGGALTLGLGRLLLPAGPYLFECDIEADEGPLTARITLGDPRRLSTRLPVSKEVILPGGSGTATFRFEKPLAPQDPSIGLACEPDCVLTGWRLRPDVDRILSDLERFRDSGRPLWAASFPDVETLPERKLDETRRIGRGLELVSFAFPERLRRGETFTYGLRFAIEPRHVEAFRQLAVFVHLHDPNAKTSRAFDFPLEDAAFGAAPLLARIGKADLPAGRYRLQVGVWDVFFRERLEVRGDPRNVIDLGEVEVVDSEDVRRLLYREGP